MDQFGTPDTPLVMSTLPVRWWVVVGYPGGGNGVMVVVGGNGYRVWLIWPYLALFGPIWPLFAPIWPLFGPYLASIWPYLALFCSCRDPAAKMVLSSVLYCTVLYCIQALSGNHG